eukprot:COSAG02_NODE_4274_length_5560_cov_2.722212_1_plen_101_part_00
MHERKKAERFVASHQACGEAAKSKAKKTILTAAHDPKCVATSGTATHSLLPRRKKCVREVICGHLNVDILARYARLRWVAAAWLRVSLDGVCKVVLQGHH